MANRCYNNRQVLNFPQDLQCSYQNNNNLQLCNYNVYVPYELSQDPPSREKRKCTSFTPKFVRINHENLLPNQSSFYCFGEHGLCLDEANFLHKTDTLSSLGTIKMPNFSQDFSRAQSRQKMRQRTLIELSRIAL